MYAVKQDLVDRFGAAELIQLTDRTNRPATTIDDTVVGRAIADAEALVDGYLAARYALPLATVPAILTRTTCDLARFYLHGQAAEKDGPVDRANTAALQWLRDVSRGVVQLEVGGETAAPVGGGQVKTTGPTRLLSRDTLRAL